MPKLLTLVAGAIILAGCASNSTQAVATSNGATEAAETEKPKMRCKREKTTESPRLGKRVCRPIDN